jgi:hypothetical protein
MLIWSPNKIYIPKRGKIKFKTLKLPPLEGVTLTFTPINPAKPGVFLLIIAGSTGEIYLPHFEKESQPLLGFFPLFHYSNIPSFQL